MIRALVLTALLSTTASSAQGERLDKRFGVERERGYRAEREFEGRDAQFKNRDRANFLGVKAKDHEYQAQPETPKLDLQAPAAMGLQR